MIVWLSQIIYYIGEGVVPSCLSPHHVISQIEIELILFMPSINGILNDAVRGALNF